MSNVRLAVIFYSTYGTNHQMAEIAAEAAREAGAEVRLLRVAETAPPEVVEAQEGWKAQAEKMSAMRVAHPDDMDWANAYLFSTGTRYGGATSQMRAFIDTLGPKWLKGAMADKPVTAMTSAGNAHGGQEATILSLYNTFMHWGSLIVPPGYTDQAVYDAGGNPYGYSHTAGQEIDDKARAAIGHQVRRLVRFAERLAG
jgi:NAD(P)H dehydrogenase (quinone)